MSRLEELKSKADCVDSFDGLTEVEMNEFIRLSNEKTRLEVRSAMSRGSIVEPSRVVITPDERWTSVSYSG